MLMTGIDMRKPYVICAVKKVGNVSSGTGLNLCEVAHVRFQFWPLGDCQFQTHRLAIEFQHRAGVPFYSSVSRS